MIKLVNAKWYKAGELADFLSESKCGGLVRSVMAEVSQLDRDQLVEVSPRVANAVRCAGIALRDR